MAGILGFAVYAVCARLPVPCFPLRESNGFGSACVRALTNLHSGLTGIVLCFLYILIAFFE